MKPDLTRFSCLRKTGSGWELWTTFYFALLDFYLLDKAIESGGIDCVLVLKVSIPSSLKCLADALAPPDTIFINIDNNSN